MSVEHVDRAIAGRSDLRAVLDAMAAGAPLEDSLTRICDHLGHRFPDALVTIMRLDVSGSLLRIAAAPRLPPAFAEALDRWPVGEGSGACGSAVATGRTVIISDVETHPYTAAAAKVMTPAYGVRSVWSTPVIGPKGNAIGTVAIYRRHPHQPDRTERDAVRRIGSLAALAISLADAEAALQAAVECDPLTGLYNRTAFVREVESRVGDGRQLAVLFCDIDRFKWINESMGHAAGDRVLVEAAERIRAVLGERALVARFGSDEFTVLLEDRSADRVQAASEALEAAFSDPFRIDGEECFLGVSVGIAMSSPTEGTGDLILEADTAMFEAKDRGRARHVWFDERLRLRAEERVQAETSLRRAIDRREFVLHYQPVADLRTGRWSALEALTRWQKPGGELVGPDRFIPLTEETGLIHPLGSLIIDESMGTAAALRRSHPGLSMAVNMSAVQLTDPGIVGRLREGLDRSGLDPADLVVELTESTLMEDFPSAGATLEAIAGLGVRLVIDDFGTGYSSISRLNDLPVEGIKIDHSFVRRMDTDPAVDAVLAAIVGLAHALDLYCVAEGIESNSALGRLQELGCDFGQGFLLGRPVPDTDLPGLLGRPAIPVPGV